MILLGCGAPVLDAVGRGTAGRDAFGRVVLLVVMLSGVVLMFAVQYYRLGAAVRDVTQHFAAGRDAIGHNAAGHDERIYVILSPAENNSKAFKLSPHSVLRKTNSAKTQFNIH